MASVAGAGGQNKAAVTPPRPRPTPLKTTTTFAPAPAASPAVAPTTFRRSSPRYDPLVVALPRAAGGQHGHGDSPRAKASPAAIAPTHDPPDPQDPLAIRWWSSCLVWAVVGDRRPFCTVMASSGAAVLKGEQSPVPDPP